eukprot:5299313-Amphidinium_carterae.1
MKREQTNSSGVRCCCHPCGDLRLPRVSLLDRVFHRTAKHTERKNDMIIARSADHVNTTPLTCLKRREN